METTVQITDVYKVEIDGLGNHTPYTYRPERVSQTGKNTGKLIPASWLTTGYHFKNLSLAIHWGVKNGKVGDLTLVQEVQLNEYILYLENIYKKTKELCEKRF